MAKTQVVATQVTVTGIDPMLRTVTIEADNQTASEVEVAAAKTGTLTTRTDANTGVITGQSGHGVTTGARLDVYWADGKRYGMTVGTVSGTSIPIDLGAGDNLPDDGTDLTFMVPNEEACIVTAADAVAALVYAYLTTGQEPATVVFTESDNTLIVAYDLIDTLTSNSWDGADVADNPFTADIGKVYFSHGNSDAAVVMGSSVLSD